MNDKERDQLVEKSLRELKSISGQDLINRLLVFDIRLKELIDVQRMPPALIIGALMSQVGRLSSRGDAMVIEHVLETYNDHVVANFVTKKEFNILLKMMEDIMKKLEEKPFKPTIE